MEYSLLLCILQSLWGMRENWALSDILVQISSVTLLKVCFIALLVVQFVWGCLVFGGCTQNTFLLLPTHVIYLKWLRQTWFSVVRHKLTEQSIIFLFWQNFDVAIMHSAYTVNAMITVCVLHVLYCQSHRVFFWIIYFV